MSNYEKCPFCGEYHFKNESCEPQYFVYHDEYLGSNFKTIHASSHEEAAVKYARYYNEDGDFPMMNGDAIKLKVIDHNSIAMCFTVYAEPDIHYNTKEHE